MFGNCVISLCQVYMFCRLCAYESERANLCFFKIRPPLETSTPFSNKLTQSSAQGTPRVVTINLATFRAPFHCSHLLF